jgi:ribose 5-phosphate isomerase A
MIIADHALRLISDGQTIGLGTGRAARDFLEHLAPLVAQGLKIRGVPTSLATAARARELGVPLVELGDAGLIDITFDGADAVDPRFQLIKGLGGALLREKIVAASSRQFVVLAGHEKVVSVLGEGYCKRLPVEVIPFGLPLVERRLAEAGLRGDLRRSGADPYITDNHNWILDLDVSATIPDPPALDVLLRSIPGVVESGLFLNMADLILVQNEDGSVDTRVNPARHSN